MTAVPASLAQYLYEIGKYPLLTREEEQELAQLYRKTGSPRALQALVTANLRFVVKVAYEYRAYGLKMSDVIQEGNLGLLKAVEKFDPRKEIRLISYAVWWIRAYIQNYVLKNWSLVKLGTTQPQRKLFFALARTKREIEKLNAEPGTVAEPAEIARELKVRESDVREMEQRLSGHDLSLDTPIEDEGGASHLDYLESQGDSPLERIDEVEAQNMLVADVRFALTKLDARERFIIENRFMSEKPMTLRELGVHFNLSRERARQLELRARKKLKRELARLARDIGFSATASSEG